MTDSRPMPEGARAEADREPLASGADAAPAASTTDAALQQPVAGADTNAAANHLGAAKKLSRRALLGCVGAGVLTAGAAGYRWQVSRSADLPLLSSTVAFADATHRVELAAGQEHRLRRPLSRVLATAPADIVGAEQQWLAVADPWLKTTGTYRDMAAAALLDLWVLSHGLPGPVAGWSAMWQYVWPRDASHCAVALAQVGHHQQAWRTLAYLQQVQAADGSFAARVSPFTDRPPDDRSSQADAVGWVLWACREVWQRTPASQAGALAAVLPMVRRATDSALRIVAAGPDGFPIVSADYWEVPETKPTLGISAALLAGLPAAAELCERAAQVAAGAGGNQGQGAAGASASQWQQLSHDSRTAASTLRDQIKKTFGEHGYSRHPSGGGYDAAITFLCGAYLNVQALVTAEEVDRSYRALQRSGGGVKPGSAWRGDGVSWTPETALYGLAFAYCGERARTQHVLDWLRDHRTPTGSLPEKVLPDGRPAAVAPLAWTAAVVLSSIDKLVKP